MRDRIMRISSNILLRLNLTIRSWNTSSRVDSVRQVDKPKADIKKNELSFKNKNKFSSWDVYYAYLACFSYLSNMFYFSINPTC